MSRQDPIKMEKQHMLVYENNEKLVIKNVSDECEETLTLSKVLGTGSFKGNNENDVFKCSYKILGVYGMLCLGENSYVIFVTKSAKIARIASYPVYEIREVLIKELLIKNTKGTNDAFLLKRAQDFFKNPGIMYSKFPLYSSNMDPENTDFIFNYNLIGMLKSHVRGSVSSYVIRAIYGSFQYIDFEQFSIVLISRRSWKNVGARFIRRGLNREKEAANSIETEQYVILSGDEEPTNSFLQLRGSIPLYWKQDLTYKYRPIIKIVKTNPLKEYDTKLCKKYKNVFYLNLIQNVGYESGLNKIYISRLADNCLKYLHFDFVRERLLVDYSKKLQLLCLISPQLQRNGFCDSRSAQKGIIRTNCVDSLDRTNVVQFFIAEEVLASQLKSLKLRKDTIPEFEAKYKNMWVKNGNMLSYQYSGTNALGAEVVLHGRQNIKGALVDFYNSGVRYFLNRFYHGDLQTSYDVVSGNYRHLKIAKRKKYFNFSHFFLVFFASVAYSSYYMFDSVNFPRELLVYFLISCFVVPILYPFIARYCFNYPYFESD
ncbi:Putative phosphoinositide phosphatase [Trachipleistophora hominis]|uniref:Putative phosphoinositide phosphatase n=1 Tax=Trachipleistophora hominis TaxID=72359 RepID=L7JZN2_TRAHO|nr:Putative phosphoinositide phosphatase [Trachipleistophora hominis]